MLFRYIVCGWPSGTVINLQVQLKGHCLVAACARHIQPLPTEEGFTLTCRCS